MLGFTAWVPFVITLDFHHIRRTMKQASQGPTRAGETKLRITENKRKLLLGLSEILGKKKENSEQSKIISPTSPPKDSEQSPTERQYKSNGNIFHKDLLGLLRLSKPQHHGHYPCLVWSLGQHPSKPESSIRGIPEN